MKLNKIRKKLLEIRDRGYIETSRSGTTGVGKTLEDLLDVKENNISSPDLGRIELKSRRYNQVVPITLFTFNKRSWKIKRIDAIREYGSRHKNGRLGLYYLMSLKPNSAGLFLNVEEDEVSVRSIDGTIIASWNLDEIVKRFNKKVSSVLLVKASVETRFGKEHFWFNSAKLCSGGTSKSILRSQFIDEKFLLNIRMHEKEKGKVKDHGTGFRINENDLDEFYFDVKEILG
ncbi:MAG: MvaI/BcnI family restriction endonuclease [Gemmatimonadota bacterium]|nr:MvaI/BcnI family restriction endonuclease [Gemmatimonadota bacterium]